MEVAVCVKQIPGPDSPQEIDPSTGRLVREGQPVIDEADTYGVETALQLVERAGAGSVTVLSMAPGGETSGVRAALAMGADRAMVVSDERLAGSDALGTARVLAAACRRCGAELLVAGTESGDGYSGVVPAQVAELLGWPAVTFVRRIELDGGELRAERQGELGTEVIACPLPAVVTVTAGAVEPRYPSFAGIRSARHKPVEELDLSALGVDPAGVGEAGARQRVVAVRAVEEERGSGEVLEDDGRADERVLRALSEWKVI